MFQYGGHYFTKNMVLKFSEVYEFCQIQSGKNVLEKYYNLINTKLMKLVFTNAFDNEIKTDILTDKDIVSSY